MFQKNNQYGKLTKKDQNKLIYQDNILTKFLIVSPKYGEIKVSIDTEDWDKIKQYRWGVSFEDKINNYYIKTVYPGEKGQRINAQLHRLILGLTDIKIEVDHIDHNTLNNTKKNLRSCAHTKNVQNKRIYKNNTRGFKGVHWNERSKKWVSRIQCNGKRIALGYFKNINDAARAYNAAALKYHGEFAYLNPIPEETI